MPRGLYKPLRDETRANPNPVFITHTSTSTTSKQITDYVLCFDCEQRFSKNGETYVMSQVNRNGRFPIIERMEVAIPESQEAESTTYSGAAMGIDTDKLGYFALSMVWRGAAHEWHSPFGDVSTRLDLGGLEEPIRKYLLGDAGFPDVAIVIRVCDDETSREVLLLPTPGGDEYGPSLEMFALGIHFFVLLGSTVAPAIRKMCCVTATKKPIYRGRCEQRLAAHHAILERTSKRSNAVQTEWP
jgi:hypothetical protein